MAGLNNTNADALANAICSALNITDTATVNAYKTIYETVYSHLKSDIQITIATSSIVTVGSATTQTGPQTPINLSPN